MNLPLEYFIARFEENLAVFKGIFNDLNPGLYNWKQSDDKWSLLEIICHLVDEEREDFRRRLQFVVNNEAGQPPGINPVQWVIERSYSTQDYESKIKEFINERQASLEFLETIDPATLDNFYEHPSLGKLNGHHFLNNWLAHDYLHIKQATRLKYDLLSARGGVGLAYAGTWK
ncbi:MAG: DinB family protein [Bacteroidia bacterium]|nr:DinB family protein [Bacteroidia bacterium]